MTATTRIKSIFKNNEKVVENYFFMTALQVINTMFGILIYPYLIRTLGAQSYGLFIFAVSVSNYFIIAIEFGFHMPALKIVAENKTDTRVKNNVVSAIFTAKFFIAIAVSALFVIFAFLFSRINTNLALFSVVFSQIIASVIYPSWYFQGIQKMKIPTYIQLTIRVLSLPFLFLFIHTGDDILIYATIFSASNIVNALLCVLYLYKYEYIKYQFVKFSAIKQYFNDAKPFFWSSSTGVIKEESVNILIGSLFGMSELAFYNLAEKIVKIPRLLTMNINDAIFPKFISENKKNNVSKIIKFEMWIGIAIIALIIIFGKWAVLLLGGNEMQSAYPMAVILSITILVWLIVGSYISFVFIPAKKYYFVTKNQFVALLSFLLFFTIGILITKSIYVIIISITLSGVFEVLYCKYLIKKHKML